MCPLCKSTSVTLFAELREGKYLQCPTCRLVFQTRRERLPPEQERRQYLTHNNDPSDAGYRDFLSRLMHPLLPHLEPGMQGLDYGAGPGPTLSLMLEEKGFNMEIYDPFFARKPEVLQCCYDFITCTETAEHFYDPAAEFERFDRLLRPGGWLGVMTQMLTAEQDFAEWWYIRDPTHVCFYREETMAWIAECHGWAMRRPGPNVTFFRKPERAAARRSSEET